MSSGAEQHREVSLVFKGGKFFALETARALYGSRRIVELGVLSLTDRMILDRIAQRADALAGQLDGTGENRG